jgi:hypothetical protein
MSVYYNPDILRLLTEERLADARSGRTSQSLSRIVAALDRLIAVARRAVGSNSTPCETPCA